MNIPNYDFIEPKYSSWGDLRSKRRTFHCLSNFSAYTYNWKFFFQGSLVVWFLSVISLLLFAMQHCVVYYYNSKLKFPIY